MEAFPFVLLHWVPLPHCYLLRDASSYSAVLYLEVCGGDVLEPRQLAHKPRPSAFVAWIPSRCPVDLECLGPTDRGRQAAVA